MFTKVQCVVYVLSGKHKNRNLKRRNRHSLTLSDLRLILKQSGWHIALFRLVTLSISSLRNFDTEANKFYDIACSSSY